MAEVLFNTNPKEILAWRNDGRLSSYMAIRAHSGGFNNTRNYMCVPWSEWLKQDNFNVSSNPQLTNSYTFTARQAG